jgi:predicted SprT family Zn-dependent metalloprotease
MKKDNMMDILTGVVAGYFGVRIVSSLLNPNQKKIGGALEEHLQSKCKKLSIYPPKAYWGILDNNTLGQYNTITKKITLNSNLIFSQAEAQDTLDHELAHYIMDIKPNLRSHGNEFYQAKDSISKLE